MTTSIVTSSLTSTDYVYQSLQSSTSIRIIALEPSFDSEAALTCDLIYADRAEILEGKAGYLHYEPVSYVWGESPKFTHSLWISGLRIGITCSVDEILRVLRKPTRVRYLWIDAVCLNQADATEKSTQVPLMGQIYEEGRKTHIYLDGDESFSTAFLCLRRLARFKSGISDFEQEFPSTNHSTTTNKFYNTNVLQTVRNDAEGNCKAIIAMLRHRWFARRWVLQEAVLSQYSIVRHRSQKMPWTLLKGALRVFAKVVPGLDLGLNESILGTLSVIEHLSNDHCDIAYLLGTFSRFGCSNPSDRIYSLYGLLRPLIRDELPAVDYTLHYSQVYAQFAEHTKKPEIIGVTLFSALLEFGSLFDIDASWPSWVPNWSQPRSMRLHPAACAQKSNSQATIRPLGHYLRAWPLGLVVHIIDTPRLLDSVTDLLRCLNVICQELQASAYGVHSETVADMIYSLFERCLQENHTYSNTDEMRQTWYELKRKIPEVAPFEKLPGYILFMMVDCWNESLQNSRFCICSSGICAVGPSSLQEGDVLVELMTGGSDKMLLDLTDIVYLRQASAVRLSSAMFRPKSRQHV